jgi:microcompartment protein CcmL/EutN
MKALGLIETVGLPVAIEAADAAVKSANVSLLGYENTKGGGLITVKVQGEVGAVKAAVQAASAAAKSVGKVYATHVIPRPAHGLEMLLGTENSTENSLSPSVAPVTPEPSSEEASAGESEPASEEDEPEQKAQNEEEPLETDSENVDEATSPQEEPQEGVEVKQKRGGRKKGK